MTKEMMKAEPQKVDGNTGQIVEIHPTTEEIVVKVKDYLEAQEKKVFFNGKRYPQYADWQYVGSFYGITVKTFDAHFLEMGGRKGFAAKAMLLRDQQEIGRAEAFCLDDEPNWRNKPLFQLASMAQTRAAAKAYANLFRAIVGLAGIETTPAEEMSEDTAVVKPRMTDEKIKALGERINRPTPPPQEMFDDAHALAEGVLDDVELLAAEEIMSDAVAAKPEPDELKYLKDEIPFPEPPPPKAFKMRITEKQTKYLWVMVKQAGITDGAYKGYLRSTFGVDHSAALDRDEMEKVLQWVKKYKALNK